MVRRMEKRQADWPRDEKEKITPTPSDNSKSIKLFIIIISLIIVVIITQLFIDNADHPQEDTTRTSAEYTFEYSAALFSVSLQRFPKD